MKMKMKEQIFGLLFAVTVSILAISMVSLVNALDDSIPTVLSADLGWHRVIYGSLRTADGLGLNGTLLTYKFITNKGDVVSTGALMTATDGGFLVEVTNGKIKHVLIEFAGEDISTGKTYGYIGYSVTLYGFLSPSSVTVDIQHNPWRK